MKVAPLTQEINKKCWHKDHQEQNHTFLKVNYNIIVYTKIKKTYKKLFLEEKKLYKSQ